MTKIVGVIVIIVMVIINRYDIIMISNNLGTTNRVLNESHTIRKANTSDTMHHITLEIYEIIDMRLDRLDSVNNLPNAHP